LIDLAKKRSGLRCIGSKTRQGTRKGRGSKYVRAIEPPAVEPACPKRTVLAANGARQVKSILKFDIGRETQTQGLHRQD
jgi:hypothetical protein